jgi:hypothetical protein
MTLPHQNVSVRIGTYSGTVAGVTMQSGRRIKIKLDVKFEM